MAQRWSKALTAAIALITPMALAGASSFKVTSPAFSAMGAIPKKYTCEGSDTSPPLEWTGAPSGTKSFVLIEDDPDAPDPAAPKQVWVHWVVYAIPAAVTKLAEGASGALPKGAKAGTNDFGKTQYGGPCPPKGRHRYFHKVYALDTVLDLPAGSAKKAEVEAAMKGHVLAQAELVGTYQKGQ
jgi:Raf kinase inhibitor-like YbhB/YbcL family protein